MSQRANHSKALARDHTLEHAPDRRSSPRFTLLLRAAKLVSSEGVFLCVVDDASVDGVRVSHFGHVPSENLLKFELSNGEVFPVQVVWRDDECLGLRFPEGVDVERLAKLASNDFPRRPMRINTQFQGAVIVDGEVHCMVIRNISQQGLCIECRDELALDRIVQVETDTLAPTDAHVRWHIGSIYGLAFEEELDCETLAAAVADQPTR